MSREQSYNTTAVVPGTTIGGTTGVCVDGGGGVGVEGAVIIVGFCLMKLEIVSVLATPAPSATLGGGFGEGGRSVLVVGS